MEKGLKLELKLEKEIEHPPIEINTKNGEKEDSSNDDNKTASIKNRKNEIIGLKKSGCHGFCEMGPLIRIEPAGILYVKVKESDCEEMVEKSISILLKLWHVMEVVLEELDRHLD